MKNIKKAILPMALSVSVLGLAGCSSSGKELISTKAGNVSQEEVIEYFGNKQVAKAATDVAMKKVLLDKYKDKVTDSFINARVQEILPQYGGEEGLKQQGYTLDKLKEAIKIRLFSAYMVNDYNNVTEDTLKAEYEKEKVQSNLAHILISVKSDTTPNGLSDEEAKAKAEEIKKQLDEGADFASLAKENSTDTSSAANGGELGWSSKASTSFVSEFADAAYILKKGEVSEIVKTSFGYHIIKALDTREVSYDELKNQLVDQVARAAITKDSTVYNNALKKLFEEYNVKGNTDDVKNYITDMLAGNTTAQ